LTMLPFKKDRRGLSIYLVRLAGFTSPSLRGRFNA
jgi:hypothetical protein